MCRGRSHIVKKHYSAVSRSKEVEYLKAFCGEIKHRKQIRKRVNPWIYAWKFGATSCFLSCIFIGELGHFEEESDDEK